MLHFHNWTAKSKKMKKTVIQSGLEKEIDPRNTWVTCTESCFPYDEHD